MTNNKIRVALIGTGYWGLNILGALKRHRQVEVLFVVDPDTKSLQAAQEIAPQVTILENIEAALSGDKVDAVVLSTPSSSHYRLSKQVLEAGKHCFVEKPLATATLECQELCVLAEAKSRVLLVGHVFLYNPACNYIRNEIFSETFGNIFHISFRRANLGPFRYDVSALWDLAPHDVSLANYWFNSLPEAVVATQGHVHKETKGDLASLMLWYPEGRTATIYVSWVNPIKDRQVVLIGSERCCMWDDTRVDESVRIIDSKAMPTEQPMDFLRYKLAKFQGNTIIPRIPMLSPLDLEIANFVSAIQDDEPIISGGRVGLEVVKVLEALQLSIDTGQKVSLDSSANAT